MTHPLVSVIIPVFNERKLLRECLNSVINQTLGNIEIIIVNDASTDGSQATIDEFQSIDDRIEIILHKTNRGLGESRNSGIAAAKGKYIFFLDSDDSLPADSLEALTNVAETHKSEIVIGKTKSKRQIDREYVKCDLYNISIMNYPDLFYNHSAWNKLISRQTLIDSGIRFLPPRYAEDILFSLKLNLGCKAISILNRVTYNYRWGRQLKSVTKDKVFDAQSNVIKALGCVEDTGNQFLIEQMMKKTAMNIFVNMQRAKNVFDHEELVEYLSNWNQLIKRIPDKIIEELPVRFKNFCKLIARESYDEAITNWINTKKLSSFSRIAGFAEKIVLKNSIR